MTATTVGILHPGEMGAAIAANATKNIGTVLWSPEGRSQATRERAQAAGLEPVPLHELLERCDIVLSICPPANATDQAEAVAALGYDGLYVDANAISPARCSRIAERLAKPGARVLDGAIFGPPPKNGTGARLCLAGDPDDVALIRDLFAGTAVDVSPLDGDIGTASALKMAYSGYQKTARILAAVAHALAERYGVTDHLMAEAARNARHPLTDPDYLPSVAARAWRWAPELREIAATLTDAHLPPGIPNAAADVADLWAQDKDQWDLPLAELLAQLETPPGDDPQ